MLISQFNPILHAKKTTIATKLDSSNLWYDHLGHPSIKIVNKVLGSVSSLS